MWKTASRLCIEDRDFFACNTAHARLLNSRHSRGNYLFSFAGCQTHADRQQSIQIRFHCITYKVNSGIPIYNPNFRTRGGRSSVASKDKYKMAAPLRCLSTYLNEQTRCLFSERFWWPFEISGIGSVSIDSCRLFGANCFFHLQGRSSPDGSDLKTEATRSSENWRFIGRSGHYLAGFSGLSCLAWCLNLIGEGLERHVWISSGVRPKNQYIRHRARSDKTLSKRIYCLKFVLMASIHPLKPAAKLHTSTHRLRSRSRLSRPPHRL